MNMYDSSTVLKRFTMVGIFMLGFGVSWSSALFRLSFPLIFVSILFGAFVAIKWDGYIRADLLSIAKEPVSQPIYLFVLWVIASRIWAEATWAYYKFDMSQYLKLFMIPMLAFLIKNTIQDKGRLLIYIYLSGVLVLTLPTALDGLGIFRFFGIDTVQYKNASYRDGSFVYFRNHIVHGFHVSVLASIALLHAILFSKARVIAFAVFIYAVVDILFWTLGRMAVVVLFAGMAFVALIAFANVQDFLVRVKKEKYLISLFVISLVLVIWLSEGAMYTRYNSVLAEIKHYFEKTDLNTSAGIRINYWLVSVDLFLESWLVGAGAGAFRYALEVGNNVYFSIGHSHTHNEYLTILSQYGLIGLLLFFYILYLLIKEALRHRDQFIGSAFLCMLVVFSLSAITDSSLYNQWEGWTLVYFSAVMLGTRRA